jgi:HD-like signal output (HDOD) protein
LDENTAYTVGLLHSLGMVFIDRHVRLAGDAVTVFCESATSPLAHQEARLVGMTAPQVTAFALRRWNFSSEIADPIEFQNEPSRAGAHTPMAELLMDARFAAESIVQQMPDTLAARTVPDSAELSPIARRILALEIWAR